MVEQRPRCRAAQRTGECVAPRLRHEDDMGLVEITPEPRGASLEVTTRVPARKFLEEVLDEVLLGELFDQLNLLDPHCSLARHRAA